MKPHAAAGVLAAVLALAAFPLAAGKTAAPADRDAAALVARAEKKIRSAKALFFRVTQRYSSEGWLVRSEEAEVWFAPPGKLRWAYAGAGGNLFVVDGSRCFFHVPAQNTVYVSTLKEAQRASPLLAFLLQKRELGAAYDFTPLEREGGQWILRGSPRRYEDKLMPFLLYVDEGSAEIRKVSWLDAASGLTEIYIDGIAYGPALPAGIFRFEVPAGAEVSTGSPLEGF